VKCPPEHGRPGATYADAGVSLAAADSVVGRLKDIVATTVRPEVRGSIGGFGGSFALDVARYRRPVLVSATDGVGTKMLVAQSVGRFDTVGIDLVAMCVDDLVCVGAEPLFFLDYVATGRLDPDRLVEVVEGIARACARVGCALLGGETAEHPGAMPDDQLDLAGFAVGVVEEGEELGEARVRPGDVLIGLRSPGLRSNGYSLARHVLLQGAGLRLDGPAWPGAPRSLGDELLEPSVLYAPAVHAARRSVGDGLHAAAHVTGGGLAGNLARVLPAGCDALVDRGSWAEPRIFAEIARLGAIGRDEMARVFNLGIGMVLVVDASSVEAAVTAAASEEVGAVPIGEVVAGTGEVVQRWP
jgi:phosphoribosylformylglycinamidine cyclo-ligase